MVDKKVVAIAAIIAILVVALIIGIEVKQLNEKNYTFDTVSSKESIKEEKNDVEQNGTNTQEENEVEENTVTENKIEDKDSQKENLSGEELAKNIVKKEWGEDNDVYFYLEEKISNDVYVISVRSKETTKGLMDYEVNIKTGEISEY